MSGPRDSAPPTRIQRQEPPASGGRWGERIAWFIGLWLAGVAGVSAVAYGLRLWLL